MTGERSLFHSLMRFKIAGKTHYGWARLNVQVAGSSITVTLTGYAYETISNKSIRTGQKKGGEAVVEQLRRGPESPTLGLLAMGSRRLFICGVTRRPTSCSSTWPLSYAAEPENTPRHSFTPSLNDSYCSSAMLVWEPSSSPRMRPNFFSL